MVAQSTGVQSHREQSPSPSTITDPTPLPDKGDFRADTPNADSALTFATTEVLKRGATGVPVFELQERINVHRLQNNLERIKVDGDFGPKTETAVKELQKSLNEELRLNPPLSVDGKWGPKSDNALRAWENRGPTERSPASAPSPSPRATFTLEGYYKGIPFELEAREIIDRVDKQRYKLAVPVADAFEKMQEAAAKDGVLFNINSAFRSVADQTKMKAEQRAKNSGVEVATPGSSPHNAGYAIDVNTKSDPKVAAWIREHGKEFGFDQRLSHEPWHWEHVPTREALAERFKTPPRKN